MRIFSSSVMAVLIIAALFWGNCFSCPQILLAEQHECCHHDKASTDSCQLQSLQNFVKAHDDSVTAPPAATGLAPAIESLSFSPLPELPALTLATPGPDLFSLRV